MIFGQLWTPWTSPDMDGGGSSSANGSAVGYSYMSWAELRVSKHWHWCQSVCLIWRQVDVCHRWLCWTYPTAWALLYLPISCHGFRFTGCLLYLLQYRWPKLGSWTTLHSREIGRRRSPLCWPFLFSIFGWCRVVPQQCWLSSNCTLIHFLQRKASLKIRINISYYGTKNPW